MQSIYTTWKSNQWEALVLRGINHELVLIEIWIELSCAQHCWKSLCIYDVLQKELWNESDFPMHNNFGKSIKYMIAVNRLVLLIMYCKYTVQVGKQAHVIFLRSQGSSTISWFMKWNRDCSTIVNAGISKKNLPYGQYLRYFMLLHWLALRELEHKMLSKWIRKSRYSICIPLRH